MTAQGEMSMEEVLKQKEYYEQAHAHEREERNYFQVLAPALD